MVDRNAFMAIVLATNGLANHKGPKSGPKEFYITDDVIRNAKEPNASRIVTYHVTDNVDVPDVRDGFTRQACIAGGLLTESQAARLDAKILVQEAWNLIDIQVFDSIDDPKGNDYGSLGGKMALAAATLASKKTDAFWKESDKDARKSKGKGKSAEFKERDAISVLRQSASLLTRNLAGLSDTFAAMAKANEAIEQHGRAYKISNGGDSMTVFDAHVQRIGIATKDIKARRALSITSGLWEIEDVPAPSTANASSAATITPTVPAAPILETAEAPTVPAAPILETAEAPTVPAAPILETVEA